MSEIDGLANVLKQIGVKFMLMKYKSGYSIEQQVEGIAAFKSKNLVSDNLDYDEAVALIRILEGDTYEQ